MNPSSLPGSSVGMSTRVFGQLDANQYSVAHRSRPPPADCRRLGGTVRIVTSNHVAAVRSRCWGREQVFYDPVHYFAVLEPEPGRWTSRRPGRLAVARLLRRVSTSAGGRTRWAGDATVHRGPAAARGRATPPS